MELPLELWKELFSYLNESDRANFIYCLLGEERLLKLPDKWNLLLDFLSLSINFEDSFEKQRKALRGAYTTYLRDRLGANTDNYMNDEHLFCFQCHKPLVISIIPLNANREATIGSMKWDPEGLKIKAQKTFNYDNTHREARKFIKKYLSQPGWNEGAKSSIFTKQCPKCNISAHFERSTYCSKCHKEELPVILCGCSRGYCVLCTLPSLTDDIKINGFCYKCNRFICEECASCCHFVDINCYKRFCHRCDEVCEFCGLETSCNEHQENSQWRQSYCYAPKQKNRNWYSFSNQQTNDENTEE